MNCKVKGERNLIKPEGDSLRAKIGCGSTGERLDHVGLGVINAIVYLFAWCEMMRLFYSQVRRSQIFADPKGFKNFEVWLN